MGIFLGFVTGFLTSFQNNQFKRLAGLPTLFVVWCQELFGVLVFAVLVTVSVGWTMPPPIFFGLLCSLLVIEGINKYCYAKAFQLSPQSLVGPLHSLTIVFLVPLGIFFLDEMPSLVGLIGVTFALVGTFVLGWDLSNPGVRSALRHIFSERGSMYMLYSALLSAISVTLNKFSYEYVSPELYGFFLITGLLLVFGWMAFRSGVPPVPAETKRPLVVSMLSGALGQATHIIGIAFLPAVYFIVLKRSSILFDVLMGKHIHKEEHTGIRLAGATLMLAGIALIVFV